MSQARRAVVIVDMLNEFLYGHAEQRLIPVANVPGLVNSVQKLIEHARRVNTPVLFVACAHGEDDPMFRFIPPHALRGTWEAQIIADLAPRQGEAIIAKHTYDGFHETRLDATLQELGVSELILAGVQTDCCVHASGQGAIFRGYRTALVTECTDTVSAERQRVGLQRFRALIGPTLSLDEIPWE
jgi:nicotinamidase-related amidase